MISGHTTKIQQKSLLWAVEGYITVIIRFKVEVSSISQIWNTLRRSFSSKVVDGVKGVKLLKDGRGGAFDIPDTLKGEIWEYTLNKASNGGFEVEFPTELPNLQEDEGFGNFSRGGMNNRGYSRGGDYSNGRSQSNYQRGGGGYDRGYGGQTRGFSGQSNRGFGDRNQGKENPNKVFIGNLDPRVDDMSLKDAFEGQGFSVADSFIIKGSLG